MAIVVVGGSAKDVGKTTLVCGVIAAFREFAWTAVKITGHDYDPGSPVAADRSGFLRTTIREETSPGLKTDTARYLAAGARRALLVTRIGADIPREEIRRSLNGDRNVIFESNRIVDVLRPDVCLALVGGITTEVKESFARLLRVADALVSVQNACKVGDVPAEIPRFQFQSLDRISEEMANWLKARLHGASAVRQKLDPGSQSDDAPICKIRRSDHQTKRHND